jgi:hypothetical protein
MARGNHSCLDEVTCAASPLRGVRFEEEQLPAPRHDNNARRIMSIVTCHVGNQQPQRPREGDCALRVVEVAVVNEGPRRASRSLAFEIPRTGGISRPARRSSPSRAAYQLVQPTSPGPLQEGIVESRLCHERVRASNRSGRRQWQSSRAFTAQQLPLPITVRRSAEIASRSFRS